MKKIGSKGDCAKKWKGKGGGSEAKKIDLRSIRDVYKWKKNSFLPLRFLSINFVECNGMKLKCTAVTFFNTIWIFLFKGVSSQTISMIRGGSLAKKSENGASYNFQIIFLKIPSEHQEALGWIATA